MPAYQHMGHQSDNLLWESELSDYGGVLLSPVNYRRSSVGEQISRLGSRVGVESIFDPQLYVPDSDRGQLRTWEYFPVDVDSADLTSTEWWNRVSTSVAELCRDLRPSGVCSPAVVPRTFGNEYYGLMVTVAEQLAERLGECGVIVLQTLAAGLADLSEHDRVLEIASIVSRTPAERVYLILVGDTEPRRELARPEELKGAMRLIAALERSGLRVLVGHCSSDLVLWKAAGATSCATGKFFNLRRFTRSRFEEPSQGGGQLPYFFEEGLCAFLRESDLLRVRRLDMLSDATRANPYAREILQQLVERPGAPWVGLGWRQFLYWFMDAERRLSTGGLDVRGALRQAEAAWRRLEDEDILMEEARNDGGWLRPWRRALAEFDRRDPTATQ